jgi:hypothetical protein
MKKLPGFEVVQLATIYPDDTVWEVTRRLNEDMANKGFRGVSASHSMESGALYLIYEKIENELETDDDNLQGVPE